MGVKGRAAKTLGTTIGNYVAITVGAAKTSCETCATRGERVADYFGTDAQQRLQLVAEQSAESIRVTAGACQVGRMRGCDDPARFGFDTWDVFKLLRRIQEHMASAGPVPFWGSMLAGAFGPAATIVIEDRAGFISAIASDQARFTR